MTSDIDIKSDDFDENFIIDQSAYDMKDNHDNVHDQSMNHNKIKIVSMSNLSNEVKYWEFD